MLGHGGCSITDALTLQTNPHLGGDEHSQDEEMAANGNEFMAEFFSGVNDVRISMKKIQNNIEILEEKYTEQLQKINPKDKKREY